MAFKHKQSLAVSSCCYKFKEHLSISQRDEMLSIRIPLSPSPKHLQHFGCAHFKIVPVDFAIAPMITAGMAINIAPNEAKNDKPWA